MHCDAASGSGSILSICTIHLSWESLSSAYNEIHLSGMSVSITRPPPTIAAAASAGSGSQSVECLLQDVVVAAVVVLVMFVVHKVNEAHYEYGSDMFVSEAVFHLAARAALHARQVKDQRSLNAAGTYYSHGAP